MRANFLSKLWIGFYLIDEILSCFCKIAPLGLALIFFVFIDLILQNLEISYLEHISKRSIYTVQVQVNILSFINLSKKNMIIFSHNLDLMKTINFQ